MDLEQLKQMLAQNLITQEAFLILSKQAQVNLNESQVGGSINTGEMTVGGDLVGRDKIVNNHYYGEPTEDPAEALKIYCQMVLRQCGDLPLRGLDIQESEAGNKEKAIGLAQVYVDLDTTSQVRLTKQEKEDKRWRNQDTRPVTALEALQQNQKLVYLGDPGGGKSTFVSHLAYCLAAHHLYPTEKWLSHLPGWGENKKQLLPLLVILRDFAQFEPEEKLTADSPERLWQFIKYRLHNMGIGFAQKVIKEKLAKGEMVVVLDGLDEVTTLAQRLMVKQAVEGFMALYGANRYVLTCRILSYQAPSKKGEKELRFTGLPTFTLAPFSEEKIDQFITAWYIELATHRTLKEPEKKTELLKRAVRQRDIRRVAENPLLLTIMVLIHAHKGDLPSARALLYEECVEMLLWRWEQVRGDKTPPLREWLTQANLKDTHLRQLLWELAYNAHAQSGEGEGLAGIPELTLRKEIEALNDGDANGALQLIELMKLRAGLLLERDVAVFTFPHRTFQEYLAGVYLSNQPNFPEIADNLANKQWGLWREVIKLAVGRMSYGVGALDSSLVLVEFLLAEPENTPFNPTIYWRKVWLASELLIEMGIEWVSKHKTGKKRLLEVRKKLEELVSTGQLEPKERLLAGEALGEIGDTRPGVGITKLGGLEIPDIEFCYIPAGPFWMGSNGRDAEKPQHSLTIPYGYWLSQYLVTVGQYRVFVQATDYKPRWSRSIQGLPNQPVYNVTWYEAMKFCGWLTEVSQSYGWLSEGYRIILPSEAEWEKGARGGFNWPVDPLPSQKLVKGLVEPSFQLQEKEHFANQYPWGNKFKNNCALTGETDFNSRGVVGAYPCGRSPYGLWDMSGNLWEWTRSIWGKDFSKPDFAYPYLFDDGREKLEQWDDNNWLRIARGGAYWNEVHNIRSSYRGRNSPLNGGTDDGFRLCVSPKEVLGEKKV
jgi:formylglycine-generating enzyme required for sulfatase activity